MRKIAWFSCGAASAVATKPALLGNPDLIIARCIVREEHPDNDRFAADCSAWFGKPVTNLMAEKYNGSIYRVFESERYIAGIAGAPCTRSLKKRVREAYQLPTDHHVFGYCSEEHDRWDHFLDANNISASAPLIDRGLTHSDCLAMISRVGIELPAMYKLGYKHNNCVGCVKGGAGYWNKIRVDFPVEFKRMADLSRNMGVKLISVGKERLFLDELIPGQGSYKDEHEAQCGIFCEMAERDIKQ